MRQNAQRLIDRARRYLQDPAGVQQGQTFQDSDIIDLLNEEQTELIASTIEGSEDYFATSAELAFQANVNSYPLFGGLLFLRKLRYVGGSGSQNAPSDAIESRLIEGAQDAGGVGTPDQTDFFYALYGDNLDIQPTPTQDLAGAMRGFFVRDPGPMFVQFPTTVVDASTIKLANWTDGPRENDIMIGTTVHVIAGTGVGQVRKITSWDGTLLQFGVDSPFSPTLTTDSKIASETRIVRLFHTLLSLGAALRAKVILEENAQALKVLYDKQNEKFEDFVFRSRTYAQRSITPLDLEAY